MNSDKIEILRKSLNISYSKLARLTDYMPDQVVSFFQEGNIVPPNIVQLLTELNKKIDDACQAFVENIEQSYTGKEEVFLIKYNSDKDFLYADPDLSAITLCYEAHTVLLKKISLKFEEKGIKVGATNFSKVKYTAWLKEKGYCNCSKHTAEWTNAVIHFPVAFGQLELMDKLTVDAKKTINKLLKKIPSSIPLNFQYNISTKIDVFRNVLLHIILDLASDAIADYKKNKLIKSASAARALFEREAILYSLFKLVSQAVANKTLICNAELNKLMVGSKGKFSKIDSINISTHIGKQTKDLFPDTNIEDLYVELSNIVHPNYNGVCDLYMVLYPHLEKIIFECHDKGNVGLTVLTTVSTFLNLTELFYEDLGVQLSTYKETQLSSSLAHEDANNPC